MNSPSKTTMLITAFLFLFSQQAVKNGDGNFPLPSNQKLLSQWEEKTGHKVGEEDAYLTRLTRYGEKLVNAVKDMPHNSPIRRSLISIVANDQPANIVAQDFGISLSTVYAAREGQYSFALNLAYTPGVKRHKID